MLRSRKSIGIDAARSISRVKLDSLACVYRVPRVCYYGPFLAISLLFVLGSQLNCFAEATYLAGCFVSLGVVRFVVSDRDFCRSPEL